MTLFLFGFIFFVVLLIGIAGFLSAAETSVTAASKFKLHSMAKTGNKKAQMVKVLQENLGLSLSTILLGNTLCLAFANAFAGEISADYLGKDALIFVPIVVTFFVTVYAETLPKIIAVNSPERVLMLVIRPLWVLFRIFKPLTISINYFARAHLKLFGYKPKIQDEFAALEELRGAIDIHFADQQDSRDERAMLRGILELRSVDVNEIMVHRKNVTMIDVADSPTSIVEQVLNSPFTRLPVWEGNPDNIIGIIHAKALLRAVNAHQGHVDELDIKTTLTAPWFIIETTDLIDQLRAFKSRREHFSIVVDEYGSFEGIVTLEDILEEIVGDITDEHDVAVRGIRPMDDGAYIIDGSVTIRDVNRQLDWELPDEEASTIAGLLLYEIRLIPEVGQVFKLKGYRFEVLRKHRNQITLLKVSKEPGRG